MITGMLAADDYAEIYLNGKDTGLGDGTQGYTTKTAFSLSGGFVPGVNTLSFVVLNDNQNYNPSLNPTGLQAQMSGVFFTPEPGVTVMGSSLGLSLLGFAWARRKRRPALEVAA